MSEHPTLFEVIHEVVGDGHDDDNQALAELVFDKIGLPAEWRGWFRSLVAIEVRRRQRKLVRDRREYDDEYDDDQNVIPISPPSRPIERSALTRPAFLQDTIETFGFGRVLFGDMTVEMHESRIAAQLKLAGGIKRDIDKHADAINRIRAAGAACLNDLPEYGGKAAS